MPKMSSLIDAKRTIINALEETVLRNRGLCIKFLLKFY